MASTETKTSPSKTNYIKSVMWLIEATFRSFAGYILIGVLPHTYITLATGLYALSTAAVIVIMHFIRAHK